MRRLVNKKVELFEKAFAQFLKNTGPSYDTYPGIGICDPPQNGSDRHRNWKFGDSYEKLTNFIKVIVVK